MLLLAEVTPSPYKTLDGKILEFPQALLPMTVVCYRSLPFGVLLDDKRWCPPPQTSFESCFRYTPALNSRIEKEGTGSYLLTYHRTPSHTDYFILYFDNNTQITSKKILESSPEENFSVIAAMSAEMGLMKQIVPTPSARASLNARLKRRICENRNKLINL